MVALERFLLIGLGLLVGAGTAPAQERSFSKDDRITPERLGLPPGNTRTSEPFVTRVYKTDEWDRVLKPQPKGYPFTVRGDYTLGENETARVHEGVDLSSRPPGGKTPAPLDFKAGVYGVVLKAGDGPWGTITVQIRDGSLIQYLHTSASHVKVGDVVAPDTKLGVTGRTGAGVIHLHVQARDRSGNAVSPDLAFRAGQRKLESKEKLEKPDPDQLDFDPDAYSPVNPRTAGRSVSSTPEPHSKWVVEVIGEGAGSTSCWGSSPPTRTPSIAPSSGARPTPTTSG